MEKFIRAFAAYATIISVRSVLDRTAFFLVTCIVLSVPLDEALAKKVKHGGGSSGSFRTNWEADTLYGFSLTRDLSDMGNVVIVPLSNGEVLVGSGALVDDGAYGTPMPGITKLTGSGFLDSTFGGGRGYKTYMGLRSGAIYGPPSATLQLLVESSGKIIMLDDAGNLTGLNSDGSIDSSFTSPSDQVVFTGAGSLALPSQAVALQSDGKIVAEMASSSGQTYLARYYSNGSPDTSFGNAGRISQSAACGGNVVLINNASGQIIAGACRYNYDGTQDLSYGGNGIVNLGGHYSLLDANGKILTSAGDPGLSRLNSDGTPDSSFDASALNGVFNGFGTFAIGPDGKIVVAGESYDQLNVLYRLNSDGSLDSSFLLNGVGFAASISANQPQGLGPVAVQTFNSISRIVTGGWAVPTFSSDEFGTVFARPY